MKGRNEKKTLRFWRCVISQAGHVADFSDNTLFLGERSFSFSFLCILKKKEKELKQEKGKASSFVIFRIEDE